MVSHLKYLAIAATLSIAAAILIAVGVLLLAATSGSAAAGACSHGKCTPPPSILQEYLR